MVRKDTKKPSPHEHLHWRGLAGYPPAHGQFDSMKLLQLWSLSSLRTAFGPRASRSAAQLTDPRVLLEPAAKVSDSVCCIRVSFPNGWPGPPHIRETLSSRLDRLAALPRIAESPARCQACDACR